MRKILTVLAALLIAGAVYAFGPVPGADNFLWVDQASGSPRVNVNGANFHVTGSSVFDGAVTLPSSVTLASATLTSPSITTPTISSPAITGILSQTPQTFTIADDGAGTTPSGTLTPTSNVILATCADTDNCTVVMGETGQITGTLITIVNMGTPTMAFADTSGVSETTGTITLGQYDSLRFVYATDRWVELSTSNN